MKHFNIIANDLLAEIDENTAKVTNVNTNLSISTGSTTARINSSDGHTTATIPVATTSVGGLMSADIFDEHAVNKAKVGLPSSVSPTEAGYLDGVTSAIQTQLNAKATTATTYSYQYVHFFSISDNDDNWATPHVNGWVAYGNKWTTDLNTNSTTIGATASIGRNQAMTGFIVPSACVLVGFYAMIRNNEADNQSHVGIWHNTYANIGAYTGASNNWALRAYAASDKTGGSGNSYQGPCEAKDTTRSLALAAGDFLLPAVMEETSNKVYFNITLVLKTPIL